MMRVFLAVLLVGTSPALAAQIREKQVLAGKERLDPALGYIFIKGESKLMGTFLRVPDDADRTAHAAARAEALAKAQAKHARTLANWEKLPANSRGKQPVAPTDENFPFPPVEMDNLVTFNELTPFARDATGKGASYLMSVKPGRYVYYGPVATYDEIGMIGACYCMGSLGFDVQAGEITNLGTFLSKAPVAPPDWPEAIPAGKMMFVYQFLTTSINKPVPPGPPDFTLPASLQDWPSRTPEFRAIGRIRNWMRTMVTRMPPVPGILAYERDRVIDARTGQPAATVE